MNVHTICKKTIGPMPYGTIFKKIPSEFKINQKYNIIS